MLLFLFGSKEDLVAALLARARAEELEMLAALRADLALGQERARLLPQAVEQVWRWLADPAHRELLGLGVEAYARSLTAPRGPWAGFARASVHQWLAVLADLQPGHQRDSPRALAQRTLALAALRAALLDLLATGEVERTTAAITEHLRHLH